MNIADLFIVGFPGTELSSELASELRGLQPAGVIFFDQNIESQEQVIKLTSDLKDLLGEDLLISVDQEGGRVQRLRKITSPLISLRELGEKCRQTNSTQALKDHAELMCRELKALGFNYNFAPCLDLDSNSRNPVIGERSLTNDLDEILLWSRILIEEYRRHGIISCAKHFPGHGDTDLDSHLDLPLLDYQNKYGSLAEFDRHLQPFIAAVAAGIDTVMIGHLLISHIDTELPASLSHKIITGLLRQQIGFQGVVCSDELTMKALSGFGSYTEVCELAILAANDLLIWNVNLADAITVNQELRNSSHLRQNYEVSQARIAKLKKTSVRI